MERKHRALLLALPTVLTLLFFFVAPMVYILVHTLHENGFSDFVDFLRRSLLPQHPLGHPPGVPGVHRHLPGAGLSHGFLHGPDQVPYEAGHDDCDPVSFFGQRCGPFLRLDGHSGNQRPFEPATPVLGAYLRPSENSEHGDGGHHRHDPPAGALHGPLPGGRAPEH